LPEEELKGIIAHEIGHIVRGHTIALLLTVVGNGIFTVIMIVNQIAANIFIIMAGLFRNGFIQIIMRLSAMALNIFVILFMFLTQVILSVNSRKNEYEADYFAYETGYGENLVEALYILHNTSMGRKMKLRDRLRSSHPHLTKRIARLEEIIDGAEDNEDLIEN